MSEDSKSSPSSRSSGNAAQSTPRAVVPDIVLVVRKQPPTHAFSQEWFDVEFGLDVAKPSSSTGSAPRTGDTDAEFVASLHYAKSGKLVPPTVARLVVEPQSVWFSLRGSPPRRKKRIRCQIQIDTLRSDKADAFSIKLSPAMQDNPLSRELTPVSTTTISLVKHKIRVKTADDWENIWYKDEGGRDKCMTVIASLYDAHNQLLTGEEIPMQLTLCYANDDHHPPIKVTKQDILRTIGGARETDKISGKCALRFRIEDVSKNHQGQDFRVEVSPEAKGYKDVAPGLSPSVSVRSKRNKRHRSQVAGGGARHDHHHHRAHVSPSAARAMAAAYGDDHRPDSQFSPADLPRLRDALKGIIHWTEEVVNGLYPLQWQVLGYHQNPDGSPDYNRPYHNMPNPNSCISRVLGMYSESTREQLMVLLQAIERGSGAPHDPYAASAMIPPPPAPRAEEEQAYHTPRGMPPMGGRQPHFAPPGIHPAVAQEAFRDKPPQDAMMNYGHPGPTGMMHMAPGMHPHAMAAAAASHRPLPRGLHVMQQQQQPHHGGLRHDEVVMTSPTGAGDANREPEVSFVLAKQFKSVRTGERLGFPAYSANKELLGFYGESAHKVGVGQFVPIHRHRDEFGPNEIMQATGILQDAMDTKSEAVHALKDWGSISNLLDHALVYDWSKDITGQPNTSSRPTSPS